MKSTILITGGAGFIGSNLVEGLLSDDRVQKIRILDNLSSGCLNNISSFIDHEKVEFIEGDIKDYETCWKTSKGVDLICHQAALGSIPRSINDPVTTNAVNISGTVNVFTAAKENKVKKVVYACSSSVYGNSKVLPKHEQINCVPISPYAVSKLVNEMYARVFAALYSPNFIGLRYFNVFGPKQNTQGAYAAVIPLFAKAILENKPPTIFGDGLQSRDFTYVGNVVKANKLALFTKKQSAENKVYNIACGDRTTVLELFNLMKQINHSSLEPLFKARRPGDVLHSHADISKARKFLAYQPAFSLKKGLQKTLEWYSENTHLLNTQAINV